MRIDYQGEYLLKSVHFKEFIPSGWLWQSRLSIGGPLLVVGGLLAAVFLAIGLQNSLWIAWGVLLLTFVFMFQRARQLTKQNLSARLTFSPIRFRLTISAEGVTWDMAGAKSLRFHWSCIRRIASTSAGLLLEVRPQSNWVFAPADAFATTHEQNRVAALCASYQQKEDVQEKRIQQDLMETVSLPPRTILGEERFRRHRPPMFASWKPSGLFVFFLCLCIGSFVWALFLTGAMQAITGAFSYFLSICLTFIVQLWLPIRLDKSHRLPIEDSFVVLTSEGLLKGNSLSDEFIAWSALCNEVRRADNYIEVVYKDNLTAAIISHSLLGNQRDVEEALSIVDECLSVAASEEVTPPVFVHPEIHVVSTNPYEAPNASNDEIPQSDEKAAQRAKDKHTLLYLASVAIFLFIGYCIIRLLNR